LKNSILSGDGGRPPGLAQLARLNDEQLMAGLQAGWDDALAILFDRYHKLVFSIALRIVRDRGEAEDVTQVVFLDIFRAVAQFDPAKGSAKSWVLQYAYHRALSRRQYLTARHFYGQAGDEALERHPAQEPSTFGRLTSAELQRLVAEGLGTLNRAQRRVIELASHDGFSMKEIAERTGETLVNVRHHYYRGLRKLRSFMERPAAHAANDDE
jgi:RNA polymerase sigma-70 factor (ECF subfamily)